MSAGSAGSIAMLLLGGVVLRSVCLVSRLECMVGTHDGGRPACTAASRPALLPIGIFNKILPSLPAPGPHLLLCHAGEQEVSCAPVPPVVLVSAQCNSWRQQAARMASKAALTRLQKEYKAILKVSVPPLAVFEPLCCVRATARQAVCRVGADQFARLRHS